MTRRPRVTFRPSYRYAVNWIAQEDNAGSGDRESDIVGYISTALISDLLGAHQEDVAADVAKRRRVLGLTVTEED